MSVDPLAWLTAAATQADPEPLPPRPRVLRTEPSPAGPMAWADDAACAGMDPDLFYPEHTGNTAVNAKVHLPENLMAPAREVCDRCDVRPACLDHALHNEPIGIWAGTDPHGRRQMRKALGIEGNYGPDAYEPTAPPDATNSMTDTDPHETSPKPSA